MKLDDESMWDNWHTKMKDLNLDVSIAIHVYSGTYNVMYGHPITSVYMYLHLLYIATLYVHVFTLG